MNSIPPVQLLLQQAQQQTQSNRYRFLRLAANAAAVKAAIEQGQSR